MKIALSAGHTLSGKGTGAVGYINESNETRVMFDLVKKWLVADGHTVYACNVDKSDTYLQQQVALANKQAVDIAVQIHFNAHKSTTSAMGTETLHDLGSTKGKEFATRVHAKLATVFKNRGVKERNNLYWLNNTKAPAILIETCFVDSKADTDLYKANKDKVAKLIAEGIVGKSIAAPKPPSSGYQVGTYQKDVIVNTGDGSNLNVRSGRGAEFPKIGSFADGTKVNVWYIDKASDGSLWGSCSCNGKTGYIHMGYTKPL